MITLFSLAIYICTFILGLVLDKEPENSKYRRAYVIWLYVFLCFGYMTGSDWRGYELEYGDINSLDKSAEIGSRGLLYAMSLLIEDYWITVGILKCLYLYSFRKMIREFTEHDLLATSFILFMLCFLLINNPLRYMMALILINYSIVYFNRNKMLAIILLLSSVTFHSTCVFFVLALPLSLIYSGQIAKLSNKILVILYLIVLFITSNLQNIQIIFLSGISLIRDYVDVKDYTKSYSIENDDSLLLTGNIIKIVLFFVCLFTRKYIDLSDPKRKMLVGMAILYFFIDRLFIIVPTGFRLVIPYGYFYAIYCAYLLYSRGNRVFYLLFVLTLTTFAKNIYESYAYIPYSNSIQYIISGHKTYTERSMYNIVEYFKRTGKYPDN